MAVNFKNKSVAQAIVQEAEAVAVHKPKFQALTEEQVFVDEMVQLQQQMAVLEVDKMQARFDELKGRLAARAAEFDPEHPCTFKGTLGEVTFKAAPKALKVVDQAALITAIQQEVFNKIAKAPVGDLKKYLDPNELAALVAAGVLKEAYGTRHVCPVSAYGHAA